MQGCPNCGYSNRPGVVFCENCGTSLIGGTGVAETRALVGKTGTLIETISGDVTLEDILDGGFQEGDEFPVGGSLQLEIGEVLEPLVLPVEGTILFGRRDAAAGSIPEVDLTPYAGYRMGVSRRHAEIRLENKKYLNLYDLGSSNGTFLNGDRLLAHRSHRISNGDEIRFGQLVIKVRFRKKDSGLISAAVISKPSSADEQEAKDETQLKPFNVDKN